MTLVGIPEREQDAACRTVAAVLHLGNVDFVEAGEQDSSTVAPDAQRHLSSAAKLLGVDAEGLLRSLTSRTRQTVDGAPLPAVAPCSATTRLCWHRQQCCHLPINRMHAPTACCHHTWWVGLLLVVAVVVASSGPSTELP